MKLKDVNNEIKEKTDLIEVLQVLINEAVVNIRLYEREQINLKRKIDQLKNIEVKTGSILK